MRDRGKQPEPREEEGQYITSAEVDVGQQSNRTRTLGAKWAHWHPGTHGSLGIPCPGSRTVLRRPRGLVLGRPPTGSCPSGTAWAGWAPRTAAHWHQRMASRTHPRRIGGDGTHHRPRQTPRCCQGHLTFLRLRGTLGGWASRGGRGGRLHNCCQRKAAVACEWPQPGGRKARDYTHSSSADPEHLPNITTTNNVEAALG